MTEPVIRIENRITTTHVRVYHVPFEITDVIAGVVANLSGVQAIEGHRRYSITIEKGGAFAWEAVEPGILAMLRFIHNVDIVPDTAEARAAGGGI